MGTGIYFFNPLIWHTTQYNVGTTAHVCVLTTAIDIRCMQRTLCVYGIRVVSFIVFASLWHGYFSTAANVTMTVTATKDIGDGTANQLD